MSSANDHKNRTPPTADSGSSSGTRQDQIRPAKTLILCFDGTDNAYGDQNTNIIKLCGLLRKDEMTEKAQQMVFYQPGIGTWFDPGVVSPALTWLASLLDRAFAWYLAAHVMDGYRFLMQNYRAGDRICLFGFSRGAYTARALAGFLHKTGLLPRDNEQQITFAYKMYKDESPEGNERAEGFKQTFCQAVTIDFVGVWDTVSSVGVIMSKTLPYTNTNDAVKVFRHALSLDERRVRFQPNLFHWSANHKFIETDDTKAETGGCIRVKEVWFAGCHSDVGGGNEKNSATISLANVSLRWMVKETLEANVGVQFDEAAMDRAKVLPAALQGKTQLKSMPLVAVEEGLQASDADVADVMAPIHDMLLAMILWWILEIIPLQVMWQDISNKWHSEWTINFGRGRDVRTDRPNFHVSVAARMEATDLNPRYTPKAKYTEGSEVYVT